MKAFHSGREAKEFPVERCIRGHPLLLACVLSFLVALNASAQQTPPKTEVGGRLHTFGELLRERNVELTEPALLRALKSSDADVRFLSALKLAEDKVVGAVPAIKAALAAETVPRDRANIALALGLLGDPSGHDELKKMCADENLEWSNNSDDCVGGGCPPRSHSPGEWNRRKQRPTETQVSNITHCGIGHFQAPNIARDTFLAVTHVPHLFAA